MIGLKFFAAVVASAALAGCAGRGPLNFSKLGPEHDPTRACLATFESDPQLSPLVRRLGPFGGAPSPTLDMRASKDVPTEDERRALSYWGQRRQACHNEGVAFRDANAPTFYRNAADWQTASLLGIMAKLYGGDLNYSQFISERDRLGTEFRQMIASGASQHHQAEMQQRQADAARSLAVMQAFQASQPPPAIYQPVPVPPMPRTINCTTMPMGAGWTNTQCR